MNISLGQPDWAWPAALLLAGIGIFIAWSYARSPLTSTKVKWTAASLKFAGFSALLLCLLDPRTSRSRSRDGDNLFLVLADNSRSLNIHDVSDPLSRGEKLKALLQPKPEGWQQKLTRHFETHRFQLDSALRPVNDFAELTFDGSSTQLGLALHEVKERFRGSPVAGVLLFTDGNSTDPLPESDADLPPVFPVILGSDEPIRDLAVEQVNATQSPFEDAPVFIDAKLRASRARGETATVSLYDGKHKLLDQQKHVVKEENETFPVRFKVPNATPGASFYSVEIAGSTEATKENNLRHVAVNRPAGEFRILYIAGEPNWEHKFLQRALEQDPQLKMSSLIRIARRERKIAWRKREEAAQMVGEFAGDEEAQLNEQPLFLRLNLRDPSELRAGFPKTADDLYAYDAVIVDALEARFFTAEQLRLLQKFVSERGGSLLMLGGPEGFHRGGYAKTPLSEMLPVYIDQPSAGLPEPDARWDLTREGLLVPWARLRERQEDEVARLRELPSFESMSSVRGLKPGATLVAAANQPSGPKVPTLAMHAYGKGRVMAMMAGDFWRTGFGEEKLETDMEKLWRQIMRALVTDVPRRVSISAEVDPERSEKRSLRVLAWNPRYEAAEEASPAMRLEMPSGEKRELLPEMDPGKAGVFTAEVPSATEGAYKASVTVTGPEFKEPGKAELGWCINQSSNEFEHLAPDRQRMAQLAAVTGGKVIAEADLANFVTALPDRKLPVMETYTDPWWHHPFFFLFALGCFIGEWGLRRQSRLP